MGIDVTNPLKIVGFLLLLILVAAPDITTAQTVYATSGAGRGDLGSARLQAQMAVEQDRNNKAEACGNVGQLYGPAFVGAKDANGCLTSLRINSGGGITVTGNSTFNNNLTVAGTLAIAGTASAAAPLAATDVATKDYVDSAIAAGGGGGGGVVYRTVCAGSGCTPPACDASDTSLKINSNLAVGGATSSFAQSASLYMWNQGNGNITGSLSSPTYTSFYISERWCGRTSGGGGSGAAALSLLPAATPCNATYADLIRYSNNKMEYCDGSTWQAVSNGSSGGGGLPSGSVNWNDCQYHGGYYSPGDLTISCNAGYALVSHSCSSFNSQSSGSYAYCYLSGINSLRIWSQSGTHTSASMKCCKLVP